MMLCPTCARPLRTVERQGIEIEHCADCGGMWLDAGMLDRLVRQEAVLALSVGQQALRLARNDREYDATVDTTGMRVSSTPVNNYASAATALASASAAPFSAAGIADETFGVLRRAAGTVATAAAAAAARPQTGR